MKQTIDDEHWKLSRYIQRGIYIYEFWHKPLEPNLPAGRYIKYCQDGEEIIVIEDGPYLGQELV